MNGRDAIVIDLDGTLTQCNSFREYILAAVPQLLRRGRIVAASDVCAAVAARKLRLTSHSRMKRRIMKAAGPWLSGADMERLADKLIQRLNDTVAVMVSKARSRGDAVILATAAPRAYADIIARRLGLDECIATENPDAGGEWKENVGAEKLQRVAESLGRRGWRLTAVVTDHHDDLPLLRLGGIRRILIRPTASTIARLRAENLDFELME